MAASLAKPQGLDAATATADGAVPSAVGTVVSSDAGEDIDFEQQQQQGAGAGTGAGRYCTGLGEHSRASGGGRRRFCEVGVFKPDARLPAHMAACFGLASLGSLAAALAAPPASLATMCGGRGSRTGVAKLATQH